MRTAPCKDDSRSTPVSARCPRRVKQADVPEADTQGESDSTRRPGNSPFRYSAIFPKKGALCNVRKRRRTRLRKAARQNAWSESRPIAPRNPPHASPPKNHYTAALFRKKREIAEPPHATQPRESSRFFRKERKARERRMISSVTGSCEASSLRLACRALEGVRKGCAMLGSLPQCGGSAWRPRRRRCHLARRRRPPR